MEQTYDIYIGLDVGKEHHHVRAVDARTEKTLANRQVENTEEDLEKMFDRLQKKGKACVIVDQPGNLSSLVFGIAKQRGIDCAYITPKTMKKSSELLNLSAKTDAIDAGVIPAISRALPQVVNPVVEKERSIGILSVFLNQDKALMKDMTRTSQRMHDILQTVCPSLERHWSKNHLRTKFAITLMAHFGGALGLMSTGSKEVKAWLCSQKGFGKAASHKVDELFEVLQSAYIVSDYAAEHEILLKSYASNYQVMKDHRKVIEQEIEDLVSHIPEAQLLMTMPGVGIRTSAIVIAQIKSIDLFSSAAKLASYAGYAPKVKESGKTIKSVTKPVFGNRELKRILSISANVALRSHEASKKYYEKKIAEGKSKLSAKIALVRQRINVMFAMLKQNLPYQDKSAL